MRNCRITKKREQIGLGRRGKVCSGMISIYQKYQKENVDSMTCTPTQRLSFLRTWPLESSTVRVDHS